jgi:hypothetical protein
VREAVDLAGDVKAAAPQLLRCSGPLVGACLVGALAYFGLVGLGPWLGPWLLPTAGPWLHQRGLWPGGAAWASSSSSSSSGLGGVFSEVGHRTRRTAEGADRLSLDLPGFAAAARELPDAHALATLKNDLQRMRSTIGTTARGQTPPLLCRCRLILLILHLRFRLVRLLLCISSSLSSTIFFTFLLLPPPPSPPAAVSHQGRRRSLTRRRR